MLHFFQPAVLLLTNYLSVSVRAGFVLYFKAHGKQGPAVIFIDEVDALAGRRKAHGGEEAEKTLTELLVQLDGGHSNDGILFIAATNRKDMLDEAFLRPGRIDFSFHVTLPDTKGRKEIILLHSKGKRLADDVVSFLRLNWRKAPPDFPEPSFTPYLKRRAGELSAMARK